MNIGAWVREQTATYVGNAGTVRDFRTQLRGSKGALFWLLYLVVLTILALATYSGIVRDGGGSIAMVQQELRSFYEAIFMMLEAIVLLVAPVIAAASIVAEYQRQSIDLLFSAPVTAKYFLIGKLISGYRYIWMLLVLSLPVTSACVVMGGATWMDVLEGYGLLSLHALVYMSFSIPIALMCKKIGPTVVWSYVAVGGYSLVIGLVGMTLIGTTGAMGMGGMFGGTPGEMPFLSTLTPFVTPYVTGTFTMIRGEEVPNWVMSLVLSLIIVRLALLGGGSILNGPGSKETRALRRDSILVTLAFSIYQAALMYGTIGPAFAGPGVSTFYILRAAIVGQSGVFVIFIAYVSTFSLRDGRRYEPNGWFNIKNLFNGTPSGGLPFLYAMIAALGVPPVAAYVLNDPSNLAEGAVTLLYMLGCWTFFWSLGQFASGLATTGISSARKIHVAFLFGVTGLPLAGFSILAGGGAEMENLMLIYPFNILTENSEEVFIKGVLLLAAALALTRYAPSRRKVLRTDHQVPA